MFGAVTSDIEFVLPGFSNNLASFSMAVGAVASMSFYGLAQAAALTG